MPIRRKASEISGESNDEKEHTPVAKRLKSSPTDLIIRVGEEQYEYHCHAIYMAVQSDFIDAALASPMRESQTSIIDLPDITPKIWGLMMKIVDQPHSMTALHTSMGDILLAAEKFDKYQFVNGLKACATFVSRAFHTMAQVFNTDRLGAELKINSVIRHAIQCDKINLEDAIPSIYAFFKLALSIPQDGKSYFGGLVFKEAQLQQLAPLIAKGRLVGDRWTEEEILCPLFPKHYLDSLMKIYVEKRFGPMHLRKPLKFAHIWVKKTKTKKTKIAVFHNVNSIGSSPAYLGSPVSSDWGEGLQNAAVGLRKIPDGNWVIGLPNADGNTMRVLWKCPMSSNFVDFPPRKGWAKIDDSAPPGALRVELDEKNALRPGHARRSPPNAHGNANNDDP